MTQQYRYLKMSGIEIRVCGRYRLQNVIQKREKNTIYSAVNVQTEEEIIIKAEESKGKKDSPQSLLQEGKIMQGLQGGIGIPSMHWCGQEEDYNFIVMEYLGRSLDDLFLKCQKRFTLKTVLMIGEQVINILQYLHFKNFVHRQVNPQNFMMGKGRKNSKLFLIDYSNAKRYRDAKTLEHMTHRDDGVNSLNMMFSSTNAHRGVEVSRRDDIESMLLILIYFLKGLPWENPEGANLQAKSKAVLNIKQMTSIEKLCEGLPKEFETMMKSTRSLAYQDKPDYTYYKNVFKQRMNKEGMLNDLIFDWVLLPMERIITVVEHYPLKIEVIPNEQEIIKAHLDLLKREEESGVRSDKEPEPEPVVLTPTVQSRNLKQNKQKDCLLF